MKPTEFVTELSNDALARYKTAAGADASAADKAGNYKRGDKRFSGIVKATKKQFANDVKKHYNKDMSEDEQLDGMALGELKAIVQDAKKIYQHVKSGTPLEAWMYKKITNSNESLTAVAQQIDNPAIREPEGVAEGHADQQRKIFKKNGKPVGEVGIDRESSPGNGQWYMKCYAYNIDNAGYDSYEEAVEELKHCLKQGVAEGHPEDDDDHECYDCRGTGEGQHEGTSCRSCGGTGVARPDHSDDFDDFDLDEAKWDDEGDDEFAKKSTYSPKTGLEIDRSTPGVTRVRTSSKTPPKKEPVKKQYEPANTKGTGRIHGQPSGAKRPHLGYDANNAAYATKQYMESKKTVKEDAGATSSSSIASVVSEFGDEAFTRKALQKKLSGYGNRLTNVKKVK